MDPLHAFVWSFVAVIALAAFATSVYDGFRNRPKGPKR